MPHGFEGFWQHAIVLQNVLIGLLLFRNARKWVYILALILSAILLIECLLFWWFDDLLIRFTIGGLFMIYFLLASVKVYKDILMAKEVGNETIAAAFSGFIMLGFIGAFLFTLVELSTPNSFSNLGVGENRFQNLNYFSFVSLLTIGYGDIAPLTPVAKKMAVFLGLVGNFYLTFITAIVIGKYLSDK
ncbi:potassium channel family protein [Aureispira anguillae]|uniref:Potassium channel family protein n=1 Tax=Aureispira anguillae TaxID=2864201 RepID=A0A915YLN1_9BACT|nr:potassium channel family protein [Aureispira anguillae]BDS15515.1 potassium channel family protein [Aureispira anguillae]